MEESEMSEGARGTLFCTFDKKTTHENLQDNKKDVSTFGFYVVVQKNVSKINKAKKKKMMHVVCPFFFPSLSIPFPSHQSHHF